MFEDKTLKCKECGQDYKKEFHCFKVSKFAIF